MTYFIIPHIHTNILPSHLKIQFKLKNKCKTYINPSLSEYLTKVKEQINLYSKYWDSTKKYTNPYEFIHTNVPNTNISISENKPISRAFFKLIEIYNTFDIIDNKKPIINTFHLAEGPGGFIEATSFLRNNPNDQYIGITLIDKNNRSIPGWKKASIFLQNNKNVKIEHGITNDGNLFSYKNLQYCKNKYGNSMDIITADGGFDFSIDFNKQETLAIRLILTQVLYAITLQSRNGTFILKMFDLFYKPSVEIIYLLSCLYNKVFIIKPNTSRYANSEKYIVCLNFKYNNTNHIYNKILNILKCLDKIDFEQYDILSILNLPIQNYFLNNIREINSILGTQQVENILNTIKIISMQDKKKEKIETIKHLNIQKCIRWCIKNNIKYNNFVDTQNVFLK